LDADEVLFFEQFTRLSSMEKLLAEILLYIAICAVAIMSLPLLCH
jgi:hypothetical protein